MKTIIIAIYLYSIAFCSNPSTASEIEKWTDEQGTIHYEKGNPESEFLIKDRSYNTSFEELNSKMAGLVAKKKDSDKFSGYLTPLHRGMTPDEVFNAWGKQIKAGGYEKNGTTSETRNQYLFPIGVWLYFKNDKLRSWKLAE